MRSPKGPWILLFGIFCLFAASCSRNEPQILYGFIELVYYPGPERPLERYSFFILGEDDDGIENLSDLYLYHDREGLRWHISSNDWVRYEEEGRTWIGSRSFAMAGDESLPRGQYRAVLLNRGGESTERRFTYDGPSISPHPFPSFTLSEGFYRVNSRYPQNHFIFYDQEGRHVQTLSLNQLEGEMSEFQLPGTVRSAALWAEDPNLFISALTEAIMVR